MHITLRLFAVMAQQAGYEKKLFELSKGARISDAIEALKKATPAMTWPVSTMYAVNQEYAAPDRELAEGDEVAIIPPVSGG